MKNLLYILILFLPLFLFSCASKPSVKENNEIQTEQLDSENIESLEDNVENPSSSDVQIQEEIDSDSAKSIEEELDEIDEPEIIDLEPEDEEIEFLEEAPVSEQIEDDTPPQEFDDSEKQEEKTEYNISVLKDESIPDDVINNMIDTLSEENINISIIELPEANKSEENKESEEIEVTITENSVEEAENSSLQEDLVSTDESLDKVAEISDEEDLSALEETDAITPSRSVTLKKMEYLDVKYPGKGWVFMGTVDNDRDYITLISGRKLGSADSNFQFQALNSGTKILHFYKDDSLTGQYIDDYLEVIILKDRGSNQNHVNAPDFKMPVKKNSSVKKSGSSSEIKQETIESTSSVIEEKTEISERTTLPEVQETLKTTNQSVENKKSTVTPTFEEPSIDDDEIESVEIDTNKLLIEAKSSYNNKKFSDSLDKLNLFLELSTKNRDEALYYKAQILESPGELQNITEALSTYQTLTKNYAASKYWDRANKRIIYLKRFYLEGR